MSSRYKTRSKSKQTHNTTNGLVDDSGSPASANSDEPSTLVHPWSEDWDVFGGRDIKRNITKTAITFPIPEVVTMECEHSDTTRVPLHDQPWDPSNQALSDDEGLGKTTWRQTINISWKGFAKHIHIPHTILGHWLWTLFPLYSTACIINYVVYIVFQTLKDDVHWRIAMEKISTMRDATACARNYNANKCGVGHIPFIAEQCDAWFICMTSDPESIGKVKIAVGVTVEVLAELLEGFVGRLSYKTMGFLCAIIFLVNR